MSKSKKGRPLLPKGESGNYPSTRKPPERARTGRPKGMAEPVRITIWVEESHKTALWDEFGSAAPKVIRGLVVTFIKKMKVAKGLRTMNNIVKLKRSAIEEKIRGGNTLAGDWFLAVSPNGTPQIHWAEQNRQWNPWGDDDYSTRIPSLYEAGSGEEDDMAHEVIESFPGKRLEELKVISSELGVSLYDYLAENHPNAIRPHEAESLNFCTEGFLKACNGDGGDLNSEAPWGYSTDGHGEPSDAIQPPFVFEWESESS